MWCEEGWVSWNNLEPVYDIRFWDEIHGKCRKGVTLTRAAAG